MNTSLNIKMKDTNNKDLQKSITYVSASASSADLLSMAQGLTGLTTNTYESADRIQKINIDTEPFNVKKDPTLEIKKAQNPTIGMGCEISYDGDGVLTARVKCSSLDSSTHEDLGRGFAEFDNTGVWAYINNSGDARGYSIVGAASYSITLSASEGDNYAAKTIIYEHGVEG